MKSIKQRLLKGESLEFTNLEEEHIELFLGHQKRFCLQLNGKVIKSTISFNPIESKLLEFGELEEL